MNVCKSLDENFRPVRCHLWPTDDADAPLPKRAGAPPRPEDLTAHREAEGRVRLTWTPSAAGAHGYEIHRAAGEAPFEHVTSVRGDMKADFTDAHADGERAWRYYVRAYSVSGQKSPPSAVAQTARVALS